MIRHGNHHLGVEETDWDPDIPSHTLPASLFREEKPSWWNNSPWPPIGPDVVNYRSMTPAAERFHSIYEVVMADQPRLAWQARRQNLDGIWRNSEFDNQTFRVLLDRSHITREGDSVALTFRGRTDKPYTIRQVSLARRDGTSLNCVPGTWASVTFGAAWEDGGTVPAGGTLTSDAIPFELVEGEDVFLTFWQPSGDAGVYRDGGIQVTSWMIEGANHSATVDWGTLDISATRQHLYNAIQMHTVPRPSPPPPLKSMRAL